MHSPPETMTYGTQYPQYFDAIKRAVDEWNHHFEGFNTTDSLYAEDESVVYGIIEKLTLRIRIFGRQIPKEIRMSLPSLTYLVETMSGNSHMNLSDYEKEILETLKKTYEFRSRTLPNVRISI